MTIGAVLTTLRQDFPDVTISKIRFLEAEGLVTPARTASGYRTYTDADVQRLHYVLTAQRDHFWPLKVIRDALDALDRGLTPPRSDHPGMPRPVVPAPDADPDVPSAEELTAAPTLRLTRAELLAASGAGESLLRDLETFGLVRPDGEGHYGDAALSVASTAAGLAAYGIEARHLRPFRTAADREVGLVQAVATGRADDPTGEVLRLCIALHTALVKDGLGRA
jgi:DNA-binding transcriptional MerR regulator